MTTTGTATGGSTTTATATGPTTTATTGAGGTTTGTGGGRQPARLPAGMRTAATGATSEELVVALEAGWNFLREAGFVDFWQKAHGESILSAMNLLKGVLLVIADMAVQHFDPFKGTRAENIGTHIIAAVLFLMLLIPGDPTSGRSALGNNDRILLDPLRGAKNQKQAASWLRRMGRGKRSVHEFLSGADEVTIRRWIGTPAARREFIRMIGVRIRRPTLAQEIRQFQRDVQRDWAAMEPAWNNIKAGLHRADLTVALALVPLDAAIARSETSRWYRLKRFITGLS